MVEATEPAARNEVRGRTFRDALAGFRDALRAVIAARSAAVIAAPRRRGAPLTTTGRLPTNFALARAPFV